VAAVVGDREIGSAVAVQVRRRCPYGGYAGRVARGGREAAITVVQQDEIGLVVTVQVRGFELPPVPPRHRRPRQPTTLIYNTTRRR